MKQNKIENLTTAVFDNLFQSHDGSGKIFDLLHLRLREFLLNTQCECNYYERSGLNSFKLSGITLKIGNLLDQIVNDNTSRSCIVFGNSCSGKTSSLSKYFYQKGLKMPTDTIVIHINCVNFDDNTLLTVLLERLDEYFPMHRKLFSGHQKISILKERLIGISKCGYLVIFVLENCETIISDSLNINHFNSNSSFHSVRQFALYTLVDIMHSPEINLILILSTSMFDLPSFFEKRVKSRMSQRRIIMEELSNEIKEFNIGYFTSELSELLNIDVCENTNHFLRKAIETYNKSINELISFIFADDSSRHFTDSLECLVESGLTKLDLLLIIAYKFLLITPQSSNKEMLEIFNIEEKDLDIIKGFRCEFRSITQGDLSFEYILQKKFEDLSIIQHTILAGSIRIINSGLEIITFRKIFQEINKLKLHNYLQKNVSGINFEHSEDSYKLSFLLLVKEGIIEPISNYDGFPHRTLFTLKLLTN
ncbi:hypothetical protein RS030_111702 [Cryptosporidium xiaoi]|uniref:Origin recognition complex subunit 4 n=1 Tax=Cryptosporidium xiaoi TaxID=659607 RepID=A0AAV9Y3F6_9CRYT